MAPENSFQTAIRPLSRSRTSYAAMNEWQTRLGQAGQTMTSRAGTAGQQKQEQSAPYMAFVEPGRNDEFYNRYHMLSRNIAFRYPDPGQPREREGRIGGSWRHIKEVLGHTGSRVVFVDGLVRLYDLDKSMLRKKSMPMQASLKLPAHYKEDRDLQKADEHQRKCQPWVEGPQLPPIQKPHDLPGEPAKYKGYYTLRK